MPLLPNTNTLEEYSAIPVGLVFVLMLITDTPTNVFFSYVRCYSTASFSDTAYPVIFHDKLLNSPEMKQ